MEERGKWREDGNEWKVEERGKKGRIMWIVKGENRRGEG